MLASFGINSCISGQNFLTLRSGGPYFRKFTVTEHANNSLQQNELKIVQNLTCFFFLSRMLLGPILN